MPTNNDRTGWRRLTAIDETHRLHARERMEAQLAFAEKLAPDNAAVAAAQALLAEAARGGEDPRQTLPALEEALAPLAAQAKAYTLHFVGHAHIDMNWQWSWPETVSVVLDSLTTVLRLMDEYPDFTFSQSQASIYEILETYHPALLEAVAARVKEGRWEVTASHWVEGDKNLANGESLARHLLLTRAYMKKLFGLSPEDVPVDWAPDTFGHAATVPNYLAGGGVRYCYLHRPGVHTEKQELFRWRGTDGSEVLAFNDMNGSYNGSATPSAALALLDFAGRYGVTHHLCVYGVGDHGGGPTRRDLEWIEEMKTWPVFPTIRFGTVKGFFDAVSAENPDLPVIDGELNYEFTGCYTSQSLIKKINRIAENRLHDAEFASLLAQASAGRPWPGACFESAWRETLFTHFHDILPGSGVHDTRTYAHGMYQRVMASICTEETLALRAVAARIDTAALAERPPAGLLPAPRRSTLLGCGSGVRTGDGKLSTAELHHDGGDRPFVLFNSQPVERREVIELTLWDDAAPGADAAFASRSFVAVAADGTRQPVQKTGSGDIWAGWGHPYSTVAVPVTVPPLGYAVIVIREEEAPPAPRQVDFLSPSHHCCYSRIERELLGMENEHLRLVLDPQAGGIASLTCRETEREWIDADRPNSLLRFAIERPGPMNSWLIEHTGTWCGGEVRAIRKTVDGPYRCSLAVDLRIAESTFTLSYTLDAGARHLEIGIQGEWFQRGSAATGVPVLRLELPLRLTAPEARYEIPFGAVTRAYEAGEDLPALQWVRLSESSGAGVLLSNDCKYGFGVAGATLHATLIRGSCDPDPLPEVGRHEMRFRLQPFAEPTDDARSVAAARALNHPMRVTGAGIHSGELPLSASALTITGAALAGCRHSSEGLVLRLYETTGREATAHVTVDSRVLGSFASAHQVDLLERPLRPLAWNGETVTLTLPANALFALLLRR